MKTASLVILLLAGLGPIARADITVVPVQILESRGLSFAPDAVVRQLASLQLFLSLQGPDLNSYIKYGNVTLDEVVDDRGENLIATNLLDPPGVFRTFGNAFFRKMYANGSSRRVPPQFTINLAPASRAATKIAHLKGSLELADQGTIQTVELGNLKSGGAQQVPMPAGAQVQVSLVPAAPDNDKMVRFVLSGDRGALESVQLQDANGRIISQGLAGIVLSSGPANKTIRLARPIDDTMKLVVKVSTNRKIIKVPFDFQDIALP